MIPHSDLQKLLNLARAALDGVGIPERDHHWWGDVCLHLQRPATDEELERADLSRMQGKVTR